MAALCPAQLYDQGKSMSSWVFWRYAVLTAIVGGAATFFIPYYAVVPGGRNSVADLFSLGKIVFIVVVAVVRDTPQVGCCTQPALAEATRAHCVLQFACTCTFCRRIHHRGCSDVHPACITEPV